MYKIYKLLISPATNLPRVRPQCEFTRQSQVTVLDTTLTTGPKELWILLVKSVHSDAPSKHTHNINCLQLKRATRTIRVLLICVPEQPHLYACPLLGFSGYQCPLNFSCSATASLSTNSSTISASNFSPFFTSLFRKNTTAAISLLIFYKCFITYGQLL